ncbi:MAG: hypothetical protein ACTSUO_08440 [Candidatus Thorarchaeota archaeon]
MSENRLLRFFDKFIKIGDSFIREDEIICIRKVSYIRDPGEAEVEGIEVITKSNEVYTVDGKFEDFVKEMEKAATSPKSTSKPPAKESKKHHSRVIPLNDAVSADVPKKSPSSRRMEGVRINVERMDAQNGTATGVLPGAPRVVEREKIVITSPTGATIGRGHQDGNGTITGNVSGIISESGQYRLVFKGYADDVAFVSYVVQPIE